MFDRLAGRPFVWTAALRAAVALLVAWFGVLHAAVGAETFLEPDKAFVFSARALDERSVEVVFDIAPGYYLYREQFRFEADGATLGSAAIPKGKIKFDDTFQKDVETFRQALRIVVPVVSAGPDFRLTVTSQGCADAGLCYPPQQAQASVSLAGFGGNATVTPVAGTHDTAARQSTTWAGSSPPPTSGAAGEQGAIESVLRGGAFWPVIAAFFFAGVLLSLTPCVLPMLPIVSSIIVGGADAAPHGRISRGRGLALASSYALGMALVYTGLGVAAGLAGEGLAAALQNPWVLGAFSAALVALALSMFGLYEFRLPSAFETAMAKASRQLPGGKLAAVGAMGGISALIVSPCVAAPLAGALLYLSQTRDVWLGGTALFSLSAGMSVPLLLVGASAGAVLPRAGPWMAELRIVFGVLLLGVALWTAQPLIDASLALLCWGVLALGMAAVVYGRSRGLLGGQDAASTRSTRGRFWRHSVATVLAVVGVIEVVGAASGAADPLRPLARIGVRGDSILAGSEGPAFRVIKSSAELDTAIASAGRPVMLDFYADWCVSCKEMDRYTFTDAAVQKKLDNALLLRADVTANDSSDRELLRRFQLFGPPGILFFDAGGRELAQARVIGFQNASRFLESTQRAGL